MLPISFKQRLLARKHIATVEAHIYEPKAPSTRIQIFLKTHLFLSVLGSRPHGDGVFSHRKRSFSKTLSRVDLFENAVFMLSCGRVKTELFENADVKASIYDVSEHAHGSLGTTKGHFDCLFSFVEVRTAKFECSSVFVWTGIFSKTLLVWTRIFLKTDKKDAFSKISGYVWTGPKSSNQLHLILILVSWQLQNITP